MGKIFYTERDIEDLAAQGITSLAVNDDVVVTELAREKAAKLGITLDHNPEPNMSASSSAPSTQPTADITAKIKATVIARMGNQVPEELLDAIIPKVLSALKLKK